MLGSTTPSISIGGGTRKIGEPGSENGVGDATDGLENMIGGGGIADAGEWNMFMSQLTPLFAVLAPGNDGVQGSLRRLCSCDDSL